MVRPVAVPLGFFIIFPVTPRCLFLLPMGFVFDALGMFGVHLRLRCAGRVHRVENGAAGRAQLGPFGRHARCDARNVGDFIRAQTKSVGLASLTLLIGHFEGLRRNKRAEADSGREHKKSRSISNSAAIHDIPPRPSRALRFEPTI